MFKELSTHPLPSDKLPTAIYEALAREYEQATFMAHPPVVVGVELELDPVTGSLVARPRSMPTDLMEQGSRILRQPVADPPKVMSHRVVKPPFCDIATFAVSLGIA
jgi:hypothetical protein